MASSRSARGLVPPTSSPKTNGAGDAPFHYHTGRGEARGTVDDTAEDRAGAESRAEVVGTGDAVLEREEQGVRPDERAELRDRGGVIVGLHAEEDQIGVSEPGEIGDRRNRHGERRLARRFDRQPALLHRRAVRPARDADHLVPGARQHPGVVAAERTRAHDYDSHRHLRIASTPSPSLRACDVN